VRERGAGKSLGGGRGNIQVHTHTLSNRHM
jgi:hypothetical protein